MKKSTLAISAGIGLVVVAVLASNLPGSKNQTTTIIQTPASSVVATNTVQTSTLSKTKDVKILDLNSANTVLLFGEVDSYSIDKAIAELEKKKRAGNPVYVVINSPGGSVLDGAKLINAIEASTTPVNTVCVELCASMGAMIHAYGKERLMTDRSVLMYHEAAGGFQGYFNHINSRFTTIRKYISRMTQYIATRSGVDAEWFNAALGSEVWVDSEEALAKKFADGIVYFDATKLGDANVITSPQERFKRRNLFGFDLILNNTVQVNTGK